ncbi:plasmid stabilization system protein [Anabaena cylindrica PCC 7122]|nr:plasmid stabilization system protein [Anabaena cylindrica PCC 7122]
MLAQFPGMGRSRDDLLPELRSFPIKPYIIFYTPIDDGIEIIRVLHQSRDVNSLFTG